MAKNNVALRDLHALIAQAEKSAGLPTGLLRAVQGQEIGDNLAYVTEPGKYHYPLNEQGKRIAAHTGKVSTAFGPFGILESTGANPGYGVKPLSSKDLGEQARFAADYLAGRIKSAGSVEAGLAGYGEGSSYAKKVLLNAGLFGAQANTAQQTVTPPAQTTQAAPSPSAAAQALVQQRYVYPGRAAIEQQAMGAQQQAGPVKGWDALQQRLQAPVTMSYGPQEQQAQNTHQFMGGDGGMGIKARRHQGFV